ncbi:MAG: universal stress protein [Pseudonocardiaceae bacterium]
MVPVSAGSPVVVGVDGSPHAVDAARWAGEEAHSQDRALHVVHASVWSMVSHPVPPAVPDGHRQAMLDLARRWVREAGNAARAAAPGVEVVERSTALRVAQHAGCPVVVIHNSEVGDPRGPVVVGVDGSAGSDAAVEFALEYAARCAAPLVALHTWSDMQISEWKNTVWRTCDWATVIAEQERLLAERLVGWQDKYPDVEVRRVVAMDRPVRRLLKAATAARMLVVGSRGRGGVQGMLLGSTSQSLLYVAPCPIAIVRN